MKSIMLISCLWSCLLFSNTMTVVDAVSLKGQKKVSTSQRNLKEKGEKRLCKEKNKKDQLISLSCSEGRKGDRINFNVAAEDRGIDIGIEYKTYEKSVDGDVKTETKFDVSYTQILEYRPNPKSLNTGYSFNETETPIVQEFYLFKWAEYQGSINDAEDDTMTYIVTTEDGKTNFRFTVDTTVKPDTGMSANTMKIDVFIVDFPWKESGTFLALISEVKSEKKVQTNYRKVNKGGNKGVVEGDIQQIAQEYAEGKQPRPSTLMDIDFGTNTADNYSPYGKYAIIPEATITVNETRRSRILQDNDGTTKEDMDVSGETSKEDAAMTKADFGTAEVVESNIPDVVEKTISVVATEKNDTANADAGQRATIAFSFINSNEAKEIFWDPEVGVGYNSEASTFNNAGGGGGWLSTSAGYVKQQWWFGLTVMVGVVGNLLL